MVDVKSKTCRTEGCGKQSSFGVAGTNTREYCAQHAPVGMVNVTSKKCRTEGCGKLPSFGVAGTKIREYYIVHSTHWRGLSTSRAKSAEPKAVASFHLSELQVQKRGSTVHNTHRRGWSTSRAKSAEPKAAASFHLSELCYDDWMTVS